MRHLTGHPEELLDGIQIEEPSEADTRTSDWLLQPGVQTAAEMQRAAALSELEAAAGAAAREAGGRLTNRPPRERRTKLDNSRRPMVSGPGYDVETGVIGGQKYVRRYIKCGKQCNVCSPNGSKFDRDRPGHGPYWYRLRGNINGTGPRQGTDRMQYIGLKLVVEQEDRDLIKARRAETRRARMNKGSGGPTHEGQHSTTGQGSPGQTEGTSD